MGALISVVALALFGILSSAVAQAQSYEQVCQDLISRFDQYASYSLSFERREWGAIYTEHNPTRNAGLYTTYRISGSPTERLSAACYTKPDERTLALIEIFVPPKDYLWCNYSGLGRWESGDCNWQDWPLFHAFGSITPSRVTETAQARKRAESVGSTGEPPQTPAQGGIDSAPKCEQVRISVQQFCSRVATPFSDGTPSGCNYRDCKFDMY